MSNNILEPIPSNLNDYLLKYNKTTLSSTTPAAPSSHSNVTFQMDGFGNISAYVSSSGASISLQTNGVANGSQSTLNLAAGTNVTLVDNGTGTVTVAAPNGASAGSANAIQKAGASGAFVASSLIDNGSLITTSESIQSSGSVAAVNGEAALAFASTGLGGGYAMLFLNGDAGDTNSMGVMGNYQGADDNLYLLSRAGITFRAHGANYATVNGTTATFPALALTAATTTTSATAGAATALPATPTGYLSIPINGTTFKVPYYAV